MITTCREAMRQAIREALIADDRVFLMGEDVGAYGGCFAVTKGLLDEFGPERIRDTPLSESAFVGAGIGAAIAGMRPIVEIMTVNFSLLALGPDHEQRGDPSPHVGWPGRRPTRHSNDNGRGPTACRAALAQPRGLVRAHPWAEGVRAGDRRRLPAHVAAGDRRPGSRPDLRTRAALQRRGRAR